MKKNKRGILPMYAPLWEEPIKGKSEEN